ncbi:hypothetical protein RJ640_010817 [Escallonia rubra]|uniref:Uncharacterized protein n=1 Tax=Escallonia rubra TaxID=112253 RepID=A0AA88UHA4_9ASTE|nr:hypothetical protein RJ640_010817 [Escallonia rubra]
MAGVRRVDVVCRRWPDRDGKGRKSCQLLVCGSGGASFLGDINGALFGGLEAYAAACIGKDGQDETSEGMDKDQDSSKVVLRSSPNYSSCFALPKARIPIEYDWVLVPVLYGDCGVIQHKSAVENVHLSDDDVHDTFVHDEVEADDHDGGGVSRCDDDVTTPREDEAYGN